MRPGEQSNPELDRVLFFKKLSPDNKYQLGPFLRFMQSLPGQLPDQLRNGQLGVVAIESATQQPGNTLNLWILDNFPPNSPERTLLGSEISHAYFNQLDHFSPVKNAAGQVIYRQEVAIERSFTAISQIRITSINGKSKASLDIYAGDPTKEPIELALEKMKNEANRFSVLKRMQLS